MTDLLILLKHEAMLWSGRVLERFTCNQEAAGSNFVICRVYVRACVCMCFLFLKQRTLSALLKDR